MKTVIYKVGNHYCTTTEQNYRRRIMDARLINRLTDFKNAKEIIEYFCQNCSADPTDFIVVGGI